MQTLCQDLSEVTGIPWSKSYGQGVRIDSWRCKPPWHRALPTFESLNKSTIFNMAPDINVHTSNPEIKYSYFSRLWKDMGTSERKCCYGIFTLGSQTLVLGVLRIDGHLTFNDGVWSAISNTYHGLEPELMPLYAEQIAGIYKDIFDYSKTIADGYFSMSNDFTLNRNDLMISLLARIMRQVKESTKELTPRLILNIIHEGMNKMYGNTLNSTHQRVLYNQSNLFRKTIIKMHKQNETLADAAFDRGMTVGTKVFAGLIQSGYVPQKDGKLIKEVDIVPEFFINNDNYYKIPDLKEHRRYYVKNIIFDPVQLSRQTSLKLIADAKHPNISDSGKSICIGSENVALYEKIIKKEDTDSDDLVELFTEIEESLKVINFDSSFYQGHEGLTKASTKVTVIPGKKLLKKKEPRRV